MICLPVVSKILKIAVVGPESTGKSQLSVALARNYQTFYVPEYSREYCRHRNRNYTLQDELNIFYGQLALERSLEPLVSGGLLFSDTTFLTVKVWSDYLFGYTPQEVLDELKQHPYDFYLLTDIDLPWEDDPLRDFPDPALRRHFLEVWKTELEALGATYELVSGSGTARYERARQLVDNFLRGNS